MWKRQISVGPSRQELVWAVCARVLLLLAFCALNLGARPLSHRINEADLLTLYHRPRRPSFVPSWLMMTIIIFVPLFIFILPSLITNRYLDVTQALLGWSLAITVNALCTEVLKLVIGRPRPDFFYRCFPDGKMRMDLVCIGCPRDVMEGRKSFPSGHSSFSFSSLGFLSLWLCGRLRAARRGCSAARAAVCGAPLLLAGLIAASRVLDHHHHWQDSAGGALLGLLVAYLSYSRYYHKLTSALAGLPHNYLSFLCMCASNNIIDDFCYRHSIHEFSHFLLEIK